jgi:CDP-glucose 4,6-dehydratase
VGVRQGTLEGLGLVIVMNNTFWKDRNVFLTGHTGFKGSWLSLWLHRLGAQVTGYALDPPTEPSLYRLAGMDDLVASNIADIRDRTRLSMVMQQMKPEIVIHMAAQPLVRDSYKLPVETYEINVMGTVNLLEAVRAAGSVRAVVNVTTDKCYENREWLWGYRENESLGGYDPYSSSKACSELVTSAYRSSYFPPAGHQQHGVAIASARAGNVIGGGDWATDRLIPDCVRSVLSESPIRVRNPRAIRPWQHVLEPLSGYMVLAQKLIEDGARFSEAWNFGPDDRDAKPVEWLVKRFCAAWGQGASYEIDEGSHPHEAGTLSLDCSKAKTRLGWQPRWDLGRAMDSIVEWTKAYRDKKDLRALCLSQIDEYSRIGSSEV